MFAIGTLWFLMDGDLSPYPTLKRLVQSQSQIREGDRVQPASENLEKSAEV
jgi:hypothetical protein